MPQGELVICVAVCACSAVVHDSSLVLSVYLVCYYFCSKACIYLQKLGFILFSGVVCKKKFSSEFYFIKFTPFPIFHSIYFLIFPCGLFQLAGVWKADFFKCLSHLDVFGVNIS